MVFNLFFKKIYGIFQHDSQVLKSTHHLCDSLAPGYKTEEPVLHLLIKNRVENLNPYQSTATILQLIYGKRGRLEDLF